MIYGFKPVKKRMKS